jgi:hypothetical protein
MRHDLALIVGTVVRRSRSILRTRTNHAYSAIVGGIVVSSSPHACCSGGYGDLTLVTPGLSGQAGRRTRATSWEVSSAPMRERCRRSASDESKMGNAASGLGRGGRNVEGRHVSETPRTEASGESEVPRDLPVGGLGRGGDTN